MSETSTVAKRKPRGPYTGSAETRQTILNAALEVFAESGYRSGCLREIAAKVGITDAGILHHFGSKGALLSEVLNKRDELVAHLVPEGEDAGTDTLRGLIEVARFIPSYPGLVELHCTLLAEATTPATLLTSSS